MPQPSTFPQFFDHENQRAFRVARKSNPKSIPGGINPGGSPYPPMDAANPNAGTLKVITVDLSVAHTNFLYSIAGNSFWYKIYTNATDTFSVTFDNTTTNDPLPLVPKDIVQGFPFTKFFITNAAIVGASATIVIFQIPNLTVDEV